MELVGNGPVRTDWQQENHKLGLVYNATTTAKGNFSYWSERTHVRFSEAEILEMEKDAATLFDMFVDAGDAIVDDPAFMTRMGIPEAAFDVIKTSWERDPTTTLYGRIDIRYAGVSPLSDADPTLRRLKLYEFNADTPTSLLEAAVIQDAWRVGTEMPDQWNSIYERLIATWEIQLKRWADQHRRPPHVVCAWTRQDESGEDEANTLLMLLTCQEAGRELFGESFTPHLMEIEEIRRLGGMFFDDRNRRIDICFKLYPWEWMVEDPFAADALEGLRQVYKGGLGTLWIEDIYKMLWSNKGILVKLWELFRDDPKRSQLLLPAYFIEDKPEDLIDFVSKPCLGREGANVDTWKNNELVTPRPGNYGGQLIVQEYAPPPEYTVTIDGESISYHLVPGIWYVHGEPAGMGIRGSADEVTDNLSRFFPHYFH